MKYLFFVLFLAGVIWACSQKSGSTTDSGARDGAKLFKQYCVVCHGVDGKLGINGAKDLTVTTLTEAERIVLVKIGKNAMTPFEGVLSEEEIKAVAAYTLTLK